MTAELVRIIDEVARTLPRGTIDTLATLLESVQQPSTKLRSALFAAIPQAGAQAEIGRLLAAWAAAPELGGLAVGLGLRSAATTAGVMRADQTLDPVWTGPKTSAVPVRHTRAVLLDVIEAARKRLLLVSFAAYPVPAVTDALKSACARQVAVRLVLETNEDSDGALKVDAAAAFKSLGQTVQRYRWPREKRVGDTEGPVPLMHAKFAVADDNTALVTSANLTDKGVNANMELGMLIRGGPVPGRLRAHVDDLIHDGVLRATAA